MSSNQVLELLVPVPKAEIQKEIVEVYLAEEHARDIEKIAISLQQSTANPDFLRLAQTVLETAEKLLQTASKKSHVDAIWGTSSPLARRSGEITGTKPLLVPS